MIGWIVFWVILAGFLAWLRFSIWKVKPEERAIGVISGVPRDVHGPGFCFVPKLPGSRLIRIPSKQFKVSVSGIQVYSAAALDCARALLSVPVVFYLTFPSGSGLIDANRAGMPTKEEDLLIYFRPLISGAVQQVLAGYTWREAINATIQIQEEIESLLFLTTSVINDFRSWGGKFNLVVEGIVLPSSLQAAISYVSHTQITSQVVPETAEQRAKNAFNAALERMSQAMGITVAELQKLIKDEKFAVKGGLREQFQRINLELARKEGVVDGQFFDGQQITTLHVQGPQNVLGGFAGALRNSSGKQGQQPKGRRRKEMIGGVEEEVDD